MAINRRGDKFVLDWWADGRRFRKFFSTKKEAAAFETTVRNRKLHNEYVAPDKVPTFREAAESWLASRSDRAPTTYGLYALHLRRQLLPRFGDMKLSAITVEAIERWRAELTQNSHASKWDKPLASSSITAIVHVLSAVLDAAVRAGRLASNPVKKLERQYSRNHAGEDNAVRPDDILGPDEIRRLIEAATPGLPRTLLTLAAATGARSGELLGLKWPSVIFDGQPHVSIRGSLSRAKGPTDDKITARFGPTKTQSGVRDIPIDPGTTRALKVWKLQAGPNADDLVFASPSGKPLDRATVLRSVLRPALKKAGLRHVKFHSLRHSFASGLIAHGAPVTEVQHLLGHSDPGMTLKVYSHWFKGADSGAASAYAASLFGAIDTK